MTDRRLVIFDVDGTLVDSQADILAAMGAAFAAEGLKMPPRARVLSGVGLSLPETFLRPAGEQGQENLGDGWGAGLGAEIDRKLHLHARSLRIEHPITKAVLQLVAPLPDHMARTWDFLGWEPREAPLDPFDPDDIAG